MPSRLAVPRVLALALLGASVIASASGCEDCSKTTGVPGADAAPAADSGSAAIVLEGGTLNATPVPTASVAAMVNPDKLPAYSGPTGSVEGTVTVTGDPPPVTDADFSRCPDADKTWGHAFREGPGRALADAIVVVTGYKGFYLPEKKEAKEVRIEDCAYASRTVTMTYGQRLEVRNLSKDFWTPMLDPTQNVVLMMAMPMGDATKIYPKKPGHYLLLDHDRKYAVVDVYAFLHPLHDATDQNGHFRIDGLPVGKLKLSTTHPQINANAEKEIVVTADVVQKVDLVLKNVNREAGAAPIKDAGADAPYEPPLH